MYSKRVLMILAAIICALGSLAIYNGLDIVQLERGWTQIIAGTTLLSAGLIIYAIAALINAIEAAQSPALTSSIPAHEQIVSSAPALSPFETEVQNNFNSTPSSDMASPVTQQIMSVTAPSLQESKVQEANTQASLVQKSSMLDVPIMSAPSRDPQPAETASPAPKISLDERLPWKRKKTAAMKQEPSLPFNDQLSIDEQERASHAAWHDDGAINKTDDSFADIPKAARPSFGALFRKAQRPAEKFNDEALPPFPPGYSAPRNEHDYQPLHNPEDNWDQKQTEVYEWSTAADFSAAPAVNAAAHVGVAPAVNVAPSYQPLEATGLENTAPHIVGRYEANGTHYALYSDGSIEADTGTGLYRFASISELKMFIDEREAQAAGKQL